MTGQASWCGIYAIRNLISGRCYIGSAVDGPKRWRLHRSLLNRGKHHSISLQRSWNKHGCGAFVFQVLELTAVSELITCEQSWINKFDSANPRTGFNIAPTAGSSLGRKHPPEVLVRMRQVRRKKMSPRTDAHRAALSASRMGNQWGKGHIKTPEHCRKISESKKGLKMPWVGESNKRRALAAKLAKMNQTIGENTLCRSA